MPSWTILDDSLLVSLSGFSGVGLGVNPHRLDFVLANLPVYLFKSHVDGLLELVACTGAGTAEGSQDTELESLGGFFHGLFNNFCGFFLGRSAGAQGERQYKQKSQDCKQN